MAVHRVTRILPYAPEQLADLVADDAANGCTTNGAEDATVSDDGASDSADGSAGGGALLA